MSRFTSRMFFLLSLFVTILCSVIYIAIFNNLSENDSFKKSSFIKTLNGFHWQEIDVTDNFLSLVENTTWLPVVKYTNESILNQPTFTRNGSREHGKVTKLLIVSYMRSGSSVTGELFNQRRDSIYFFEPLKSLTETFTKHGHLIDLQGNVRVLRDRQELMEESGRTLESLLNCSLRDVSRKTLTFRYMGRVHSTESFYKCIQKTKLPGEDEVCLNALGHLCRSAKLRSAKVIRLSVSNSQSLLARNPDLKIIHLVRDPRGIIYSRSKLLSYFKYSLKSTSKTLCVRMLDDIQASKQLFRKYPERVTVLRYEDLARFPLRVFSALCQFIGISYSRETEEWIKTHMQAPDPCIETFGTSRCNSATNADRWLAEAGEGLTEMVDAWCREVYGELEKVRHIYYDALQGKTVVLKWPTKSERFLPFSIKT